MSITDIERAFLRPAVTDLVDTSIRETVLEKIHQYEENCGGPIFRQKRDSIQRFIDIECDKKKLFPALKFQAIKQYVKMMEQYHQLDDPVYDRLRLQWVYEIKDNMVQTPTHLALCLDQLFNYGSKDRKSSDVIYRAFCWLAYIGLLDTDIDNLTVDSVDFDNGLISDSRGEKFVICSEAKNTIEICAKADVLTYNHPKYSSEIVRKGSNNIGQQRLLRGVKADCKVGTIKSKVSKLSAQAIKEGVKMPRLNYTSIRSSGIFHRVYEHELLGRLPNFTKVVEQEHPEFYYGEMDYNCRHKEYRHKKMYADEYIRWKMAFKLMDD